MLSTVDVTKKEMSKSLASTSYCYLRKYSAARRRLVGRGGVAHASSNKRTCEYVHLGQNARAHWLLSSSRCSSSCVTSFGSFDGRTVNASPAANCSPASATSNTMWMTCLPQSALVSSRDCFNVAQKGFSSE
jgi:hypothetical protein